MAIWRGNKYLIVKNDDGSWPDKHFKGVDPALVGPKAFEHPAVKEWWSWLLEEYRPKHSLALITPCSNVKPYTRSPTSRKVRGLLRRLGLWDQANNRPKGIDWLYFSNLLVLVPYERAEEYPACCYNVTPDTVLTRHDILKRFVRHLATVVQRIHQKGLTELVVYLPSKHLSIWDRSKSFAESWPRERRVKYTVFGLGDLPSALSTYRDFVRWFW